MRPLVAIALAASALVAGCISPWTAPAQTASTGGAPLLTMDLPVHVVAVGFSEFDEAALEPLLKQPLASFNMIEAAVTGLVELQPLQYDVRYVVHEAPAAFADELFAFAASVAEPGPVDAFLRGYDLAGEGRACAPSPLAVAPAPALPLVGNPANAVAPAACGDLDVIDAVALQQWIADHRGDFGLEFGGVGYTVFVLDSWQRELLPKDRYHRYAVDDGTDRAVMTSLRGWGGDHDFVFYDVSAAPNAFDYRTWANFSREGADLVDLVDSPIWDLEDDPDAFYANVARNVNDAASILFARKPIYPFEYAEKYILPIYVFIDPATHASPGSPLAMLRGVDFEAATDQEKIRKSFQDLVPWAEVEMTFNFVYLPDGDPALADALADAKSRHSNQAVDFGVLKKYFRENWAEYVPEEPGARTYPSFGFVVEAPSAGLFAYSDGDEYGRSWGVFHNVADAFLCVRPQTPVCNTQDVFGTPEAFRGFWNFLLTHELGHSFGLTHPHDTAGLDSEGFTTYELNWLWDSTSSTMTYRHYLGTFNQFDKDLVYRAQAVALAEAVLGSDAGEAARDGANRALDLARAGDEAGAFAAAREALLASQALASAELDVGAPGEAVTFTLEVRAGADPAGAVPSPPFPVPAPLLSAGVSVATFPVEIPEGATALVVEFAERDAPSHAKWAAFAAIVDEEGNYVAGLWNNAYDKVVFRNLAWCDGGCTGFVYASSGVATSYDVTLTPLFAA